MNNNEIFNMYFGIIEDSREQAQIKHPLIDILKFVMIAVLCGLDEFEEIIEYGKSKIDFLKQEYNIQSIPSKSTLTRIFAMINPKWLGLCVVGILNMLIKKERVMY